MDHNLQGTKLGHPFLLTGLGASGTRFLANHLDTSLSWTVKHEPNDQFYLNMKPFQGAVDSTVRHCALVDDFLDDGRLWVIIRDPRDIAEHCAAKGTWRKVKTEIERDIERISGLLDNGAHPVHFEAVIQRRGLKHLERKLEIMDIRHSHIGKQIGRAPRGGMTVTQKIAVRNEVMRAPVVQRFVDMWIETH